MELSNDAKRIKEMCERRKSFMALKIADEDNLPRRLAYIHALEVVDEIIDFIERMKREKELLNE